mgnify:CR=1 FL=1
MERKENTWWKMMFRWNTWNKNETNETGLTFYTLILIISNIKLVKRYNKQCRTAKKNVKYVEKRRWWYGATIRDVAKRAGVSPATVSRYFHGKKSDRSTSWVVRDNDFACIFAWEKSSKWSYTFMSVYLFDGADCLFW